LNAFIHRVQVVFFGGATVSAAFEIDSDINEVRSYHWAASHPPWKALGFEPDQAKGIDAKESDESLALRQASALAASLRQLTDYLNLEYDYAKSFIRVHVIGAAKHVRPAAPSGP
jgi:hypothetical protein